MDYKKEFLNIAKSNISRKGLDELLHQLENSDFFTAPASTRYHSAKEGGLVEHSVKVYKRLIELVPKGLYDNETLAIIALFHDICKCNYYSVDYRNRKNEKGQWEKVPYYKVDDRLPYGHGEKSVLLIQSAGIELSLYETLAIRWHMGAYEGEKQWNTLSQVYNLCPLALYLHTADMWSTYFDEELSE